MATPAQPTMPPGGSGRGTRESTFTRNLRFEFASEEGRALVGSYAIAIGLGILWLLLVWLYPVTNTPQLLPQSERPVEITLPPPEQQPPPPAPAPAAGEKVATVPPAAGPRNRPAGRRGPSGRPLPGRPGSRTETNSAGAIGTAFGTGSGAGTGGLVGDVSGILRGVDVASGSGGTGGGLGGRGGGGTGGKAVLGYGQGGEGARTPGRGGFGGGTGTGGGGGGGIGGVGGGGGITRAAVRVSAPKAVAGSNLGGPGRDVSDLGNYVRSHEAELRFCYVEYGLKQNPNLAGTVTAAISIAGSGAVTGVDITNSTWSGPGSSAAESCMRSKIRGWHFPSSSAGAGTYTFPFNFTH